MSVLLVVDGNSILNRSYFGVRPLTNKDGLFTHAVFGFANALKKVIDDLSPDYLACAFDLRAPTFRHKAYSEYKANRHGMPEELAVQLPYAKECAEKMGFKLMSLEGFEADDIIGTVSAMSKDDENLKVFIYTGDRDSLQLINDRVNVLLATNKENIVFDKNRFISEYGITPEQFVDAKALMGDSSDNIPGVKGIGEKTALKLISECGSLDKLYENIDSIALGKSVYQKLCDGKDQAYLSRFLALIKKDAPISETKEDLINKGFDKAGLLSLFTKLEFHKLIKRFELDGENRQITFGSEESRENTAEIECREYADISVTELHRLSKDKLFAIKLCCTDEDKYLKIYDGENAYKVKFSSLDEISDFVSDNERKFCVSDSKSLYKLLAENKIGLSNNCFDLQLAAYVLNPSDSDYSLDKLCLSYLKTAVTDNFDECVIIYRLYSPIKERLEKDGTEKFYFEAELPLARVLADMEITGFKIERDGLKRFGKLLSQRENDLAEAIYESAGEKFNINSPKQLGEILFEKLGLPVLKKNKTGYSTSAEVLEKLMPYHPIISLIFEYRTIAKLNSTYAVGLLNVADENGIVHTTFNQTVTATGRLSSTEPNLQNIPIKTEIGREFRRFFVPNSPDYVLIDADYSQIELRLLAHISGDEKMIRAFIDGADIHASTASEVFGVPIDEVTPLLRKRAKAVNFGIVYGIGAYSLSQDIGVSKKEADEYIKNYFEKYPSVKSYIDSTVAQAHKDGYVSTLFGRKRYIPEINSSKAMLRSFGERVAMNSPIQGTAADIIKLAMVNISDKLSESGLDAKIILQVHDELILCAKKEDAEKAALLLKDGMENVVKLSVPLSVEVSTADNWYDCK